MKFFATIFAIAMGVATVSANPANLENVEKRCLTDGSRCRSDNSWSECCSGYCLQYKDADEGVCSKAH